MDAELLRKFNRRKQDRQPTLLLSYVARDDHRLIGPEDDLSEYAFADRLAKRLLDGRSELISAEEAGGEPVFVQTSLPPPRAVIIGAVHITQSLAILLNELSIDGLIVDPRSAFATQERFANYAFLAEWPQDVPERMALDPHTALVALTHDPKIDDLPLIKALEAGCFYVGALGSKKTHAKRLKRLEEAGVPAKNLERIHAPIGLDIGASSPSEIALAIAAEIIKTLRKADHP